MRSSESAFGLPNSPANRYYPTAHPLRGVAMKCFLQLTFAIAVILLAAQTAAAQEWSQPWARERIAKSPRHSEWATVKNGDRSVATLIVYPESKDKRPVVLVIHDIFGLSEWAQELADEVPTEGDSAVAPGLLSSMGADGGRTKECE